MTKTIFVEKSTKVFTLKAFFGDQPPTGGVFTLKNLLYFWKNYFLAQVKGSTRLKIYLAAGRSHILDLQHKAKVNPLFTND